MTSVITRGLLSRALEHWAEVFNLAFHITGDRHRAEDLCQETYLRVARVPGRIDAERPLRPFLFTVLRNLIRNEARRPRPRPLEAEAATGAGSDPAAQAAGREQRDVLHRALLELDAVWRTMLYLRDGLGLSYREIGSVLDKSEDTVRTTLHRARLRLSETLQRRTRGDDR